MSANSPLTPFRRDILLALLAVGLITAPVWGPTLQLSEPTYRYERLEVVTNGSGIEYADQPEMRLRVRMSEEIACSGSWTRVCGFEQFVVENQTVPSGAYSTNPEYGGHVRAANSYRYVLLNHSLYEPTYSVNESVQNDDGLYRVEMDIESVSPDRVLQFVSIPATADDDLNAIVARTARTGTVTAHREVEVPRTPIQLENGSYYRVYLAEMTDDIPPIAHAVDFLLRYIAPLVGLYLVARILQHIEITYVGERSN